MMQTLNHKPKLHNSSGFTMVEMLVVMIIVSVMATTAASVFLTQLEKNKLRETKQRLDVVQGAIQDFWEVNGRYPCPASFRFRPEDAGYGLEGNSHPNAAAGGNGCLNGTYPLSTTGIPGGASVPVAGTIPALSIRRWNTSPPYSAATPRFNGDIRTGAIPVRTLNLPDEFANDAWQGRFTYAVMVHQATGPEYRTGAGVTSGYTHDKGGIRIRDAAGNNLISPADTAHYIVISHGTDRLGARPAKGRNETVRFAPCNAAVGLQRENCDDDSTFILTTTFTDEGANAFDDLAVLEVQRRGDYILPRGTILAFDASSCPQGWRDYMNTTERGRFVMGATVNGAIARNQINNAPDAVAIQQSGSPLANIQNRRGVLGSAGAGVPDINEYFPGDTGEDGVENIPAYYALRYCIKQ